jgi:hypothetical protein
MTKVCEHGHQARKCEVCELRAEVARLRGVCRKAASQLDDDVYPLLERGGAARCLAASIACDLAAAGKEPANEGSEDGK